MTNQRKPKPVGYLVMYDDEMGLCVPFGHDPDCEGAICTSYTPILFETRADARRAIKVSVCNAKLQQARGASPNPDFLAGLINVKIIPVVSQ